LNAEIASLERELQKGKTQLEGQLMLVNKLQRERQTAEADRKEAEEDRKEAEEDRETEDAKRFENYQADNIAKARKYYADMNIKVVKLEKQEKEMTCVVCLNAPKTVCLLPCSHMCLCEACADRCSDSCPVCRTDVTEKRRMFLS
jgi:hypothetical protein